MSTSCSIFAKFRFSAPTNHPDQRKNRGSRNTEHAESGFAVSVGKEKAKNMPIYQLLFFPDSFFGGYHENLK